MLTLTAMQLSQFGILFYQTALSVSDIQKLVRFEVLSFGVTAKSGRRAKKSRAGVNWEELEKRISAGEAAYQRPILERKIEDLVEYYDERYTHMDLPPIPGAVLLVSDRKLDFITERGNNIMGHLQLPEEEGLFRTLDGQHRLVALNAYADANIERSDVSEALRHMTVPAVIFDGLGASHAVEMFVTINTKHTKLKKDVIVSLSGRRLYRDEKLAVAHDVIRSLNERQDSPLRGEIKILGVGQGKVSQAPLADEMERLFKDMETAGHTSALKRFLEESRNFFLTYFKQVAQAFPVAWNGRKYSLKRGTALRAFIRVVPAVFAACRDQGLDPLSGRDLGNVIAPWSTRLGDARFKTDEEWSRKAASSGSRTVELLARELGDALK